MVISMKYERQKFEPIARPGSAVESVPELLEGESIVFVSSKPGSKGVLDVWVTVRCPGVDSAGVVAEREVTVRFAGNPKRREKIYRITRPWVKEFLRRGLYLKIREVAQAEWKRQIPDFVPQPVVEAEKEYVPDEVQSIRIGGSPRGGKAVFIAIKTRRDTFVMAFEKVGKLVRRAEWDKSVGNVDPGFYFSLVKIAEAELARPREDLP